MKKSKLIKKIIKSKIKTLKNELKRNNIQTEEVDKTYSNNEFVKGVLNVTKDLSALFGKNKKELKKIINSFETPTNVNLKKIATKVVNETTA